MYLATFGIIPEAIKMEKRQYDEVSEVIMLEMESVENMLEGKKQNIYSCRVFCYL